MRVLIVGKNSYIGQCIGKWLCAKENPPAVDYISVRDEAWREQDYTSYDAVIFTSAIVHQKNVDNWKLYKEVNAELPREFAELAKAHGVQQFVFLSTAGVFDSEKSLPAGKVIGKETPTAPTGMYGKSKLMGEEGLKELTSDSFHVSIVRPMNVYGRGCRGNYIPLLKKITKALPVLPNAFSCVKQGMIYIDNLSELCWLVVNSHRSSVYMAQDTAPVSTYEIMLAITSALGRQKRSVKCDWLVRQLYWLSPVKKLFGGVAYSEEMAACPLGEYRVVDFREGMRRTIWELPQE